MKKNFLRIISLLALTLTILSSGFLNVSAASNAPYKIHFINVGSGDAILLESNGHFGLIDGGEDTFNFNTGGHTDPEGCQHQVKDYIKRIAGNANGKVKLDFVIVTHAHSDHIGGLREVLKDPNFTVERAYFKNYPDSYWKNLNSTEQSWDTQKQYSDFKRICDAEGVTKVWNKKELDQSITLGRFTLKLFNTTLVSRSNMEENENSLAVAVEANGKVALLTGDLNELKNSNRESAVLKEVRSTYKNIDLLKLGHHGYPGSNSKKFIEGLNPSYAVVTNYWKSVYSNVAQNHYNDGEIPTKDLLLSKKIPTYPVGDNAGAIGNALIIDYSKYDFGLSAYSQGAVWTKSNSNWYYKRTDGTMITGWVKDPSDNSWYYLRKSNNDRTPGPMGSMVKGWFEDTNRRWYYMRTATNDKKAGSEGAMVTGWMQDGNYWYYLRPAQTGNEPEGAMATGWLQDGGKWYYLRLAPEGSIPGGTMVTGYRVIDGKGYNFDSSGALI